MTGAATAAPTKTLRGNVIYRERMALPRGSIVTVSLLDVSLADAPSRTVASTRIQNASASPIAYAPTYDPAQITPRHSYALQARITMNDGGDERLLFINTTRHAVFGGGSDKTDIHVSRVRDGASAQTPASPHGQWLAEDILGGGVLDRIQTTLTLTADDRVSGRGGCNGYGGEAKMTGDRIRFSRMFSTQMACTGAVMNQEQKFYAALEKVRRFRVDPLRKKLFLLDARGQTLIRFSRM